MIRSDEARSEFEISLVAEAPSDAGLGDPVGSGGERQVDGRADGDRSARSLDDMDSDQGDQVRGDMDGHQVATRLTPRQRAILEACDVPRSLAELMERAGVSHRSYFRRKHLKPLLEAGLVRMTNPDNPRAPNQKYVLTDTGALRER